VSNGVENKPNSDFAVLQMGPTSMNFAFMTEWILHIQSSTESQIRLTTTLLTRLSLLETCPMLAGRTPRMLQHNSRRDARPNLRCRFSYTSNRGGTISIDVNGNETTGPLGVPTTYDSTDPVAWRQWHHWNLASNFLKIRPARGRMFLLSTSLLAET